jgi:hypothetical protein
MVQFGGDSQSFIIGQLDSNAMLSPPHIKFCHVAISLNALFPIVLKSSRRLFIFLVVIYLPRCCIALALREELIMTESV